MVLDSETQRRSTGRCGLLLERVVVTRAFTNVTHWRQPATAVRHVTAVCDVIGDADVTVHVVVDSW